jgi:hypothetical protein
MYHYGFPNYYPVTIMPMPSMRNSAMPQMDMQDMEQMREMMRKHMDMTQDIHRMVSNMYEQMSKMQQMRGNQIK